MSRRQRREFQRALAKMGGPVGTPGNAPNHLIDVAREKIAEDPTGASLDAWRIEYLAFVEARSDKYPLLTIETRRRVAEAYDTARAEAGLT